jgi:putative Mn2+ efflux pump MntP
MGTLLLLGFVLSLDSFRVSLSLGTMKLRPLRQAQIVIAFALCDGLAPLVGLLIGQSFVTHIGVWVEHLGPLMLFVYGVYVIYSARRYAEKETADEGGWMVFGLPLSLSLDNLIAGASLGMIGFPLWISVLVIGAMSGLMSLAGLMLGNVAASFLRIKTDLIGGIALICIAVALALENFR